MSLAPGTRLGAYEVIAPVGAGGMGEVYRARDPRLNRDVAIKILPESFASDPDRVAPFQREAHVLASLNHPNIAQIHGLEEYDQHRALILELVEGRTLAERIAQGPVPLDEALPIARQIAEALQAAHEHGVIHRDLKPANIKLTNDGPVKVLQPYPGPGPKVAISASGGHEAVWSPRGGELFYRDNRRLMAVSVRTSPSLVVGTPKTLFEGDYATNRHTPNYEVLPDGQRFIMIRVAPETAAVAPSIIVVQNWFAELNPLVPVN